MVQDIFPHSLNNQYDAKAVPSDTSTVINIAQGKMLVNTESFEQNELVFPMVDQLGMDREYTYLFSVDSDLYFFTDVYIDDKDIPDGFSYVEERSIVTVGLAPCERVFAGITAKHLSDWYRDNKHCGRCGGKMVHSKTERAMTCPDCHYTAYPRIMPAVIVGVINGDKILITRYRTGFAHNALIAGFVEIGETVEETVAREVMEEAGVKVKNIRYYKSQPWGTANDLLLGFYCDLDGDDTITMDSEELKYAQWVERDEIVLQPGKLSLTNEMMTRFKNHEDC